MTAAPDWSQIRLLVLDVDGVLTDGSLYYAADGTELKVFNVRDGHGLKMLRENGVQVAIISGRTSETVTLRARELGIRHVFQKAGDKLPVLRGLLDELDIPAAQTAYLGDDTPDLPAMRAVGVAATVADAHPDVIAAAAHVCTLPGGRGAVREVCDLILTARRSD